MTLKSDAKFEEKLACGLENDMRNSANYYQRTWKSQNWDFDGALISKVGNASAKNSQTSYVSWKWKFEEEKCKMHLHNAKFEEESICRFKIDMRNLTKNLKNLHFLIGLKICTLIGFFEESI